MASRPWAGPILGPLRLFPQPIRRLIVKDPTACLMSEHIVDKHEMQGIVIFRHRAAFVASYKRLHWPSSRFLAQFLACAPLMKDWLQPFRSLLTKHCQSDSVESAAVLHGCLNTVLGGYTRHCSRLWPLSYEELSADPESQFRNLHFRLGLPYDRDIQQHHAAICDPSHGTGPVHPHAVHRDSRLMNERWRGVLSPAECARVRAVWEHFEVPLYMSDRAW